MFEAYLPKFMLYYVEKNSNVVHCVMDRLIFQLF